MTDTQQALPAGWYADPTKRSAGRHWDGQEWTAIVSDASGKISEDLARLA
jgi:hypothetical protein